MIDDIIERDAASLGSVMKIRLYPMVVNRAEGVRLWDVYGKSTLIFWQGGL